MSYKDPEVQRKYVREWIAKRRADWLSDKCCVVCGSTRALEVDHIDSSTKVSHNVWSWSKERREAELAKCQVFCHKHHVQKTWEKDRARAVHGSQSMYCKHGCRCQLCREGHRKINAKYR